jgi:SAM-dependent methyltransferase
MIIHKLIVHHLSHKDDPDFYSLQARDAIQWIENVAGPLRPGLEVLDLGAGHGIFGAELLKRRCQVTFADESNLLLPEIHAPFLQINLDRDDPKALGSYELVICSNVLEHLARPFEFISSMAALLKPGGLFYLSWTNWLSPWGGHEFSPFHYLGSRFGPFVHDRLTGRKRIHTPYENLFPTSIGQTLSAIRSQSNLRVIHTAPRYYPELSFLVRLPGLREFVTWNCAVLIQKRGSQTL